jgi:Mg2+/Co2+ transporter CorB
MSETSDGREAIGPHMSEDEDPDSPARASFFSRLFRRDGEDEEPLSEPTEESRAALAGAREMLLNRRKMRRMRVDDVSVPRADIVAVAEDAPLEEVVAVFQSSTVSRLPVYSDTLDLAKRVSDFIAEREWGLECVVFEPDDLDALNERYQLPGPIPVTLAFDKFGKIADREEGPAEKERFESLVENAR